ncbi:fumarate hydratase C-terminal domain-containing protein [uncultured Methanobrevibacter sp.]|uniref:fumarate hydratase C-terminal domain-containing protein n=1 Tax=uncultured Methanobrevibacter sp. TaxID=253161 RepID=UPI0026272A9D
MKLIQTPITDDVINDLKVGDKISLSGKMYCGRDAVLPKLSRSIIDGDTDKYPFDFKGMAIMHTAFSVAGIAPTTSNKTEIESSIPTLSSAGVKFHIGKGSLSEKTKEELNKYNSVFIVCPPVAALLTNNVVSKSCVAYKEEGMEAFFELEVRDIPGIVAIAHGESL